MRYKIFILNLYYNVKPKLFWLFIFLLTTYNFDTSAFEALQFSMSNLILKTKQKIGFGLFLSSTFWLSTRLSSQAHSLRNFITLTNSNDLLNLQSGLFVSFLCPLSTVFPTFFKDFHGVNSLRWDLNMQIGISATRDGAIAKSFGFITKNQSSSLPPPYMSLFCLYLLVRGCFFNDLQFKAYNLSQFATPLEYEYGRKKKKSFKITHLRIKIL